ncbi:MAG: glycosyltransferase family 2 protein [Betaproteobacteria bacterium]
MEATFWAALAFIAYAYAGYPLAVWALGRRRPETPAPEPAQWPGVTVVMAAHNEEGRMAAKLRNLRALDYEPSLLHVIVVSDGSTDGTAAAVAREPGVELVEIAERRGKPHALNMALARATSEVILFTDLRQDLEPTALRALVRRLLQPGVGAVSGELVHRQPGTRTAATIGLYWRYEKWIRRAESRLASTVGVTGALYAMRRADYSPLPEDTILDDFIVPMRLARRGARVLFEPRAIAYDELQRDMAGERKRKVRTLTGNFQAFAREPWLFSPARNPIFIQFLSHKVFRLFVPYAMAVLLAASIVSSGPVYAAAGAAQAAFYGMAAAGAMLPTLRRLRAVSFALVFLELNWAAVLALRNFITGGIDARWEKT